MSKIKYVIYNSTLDIVWRFNIGNNIMLFDQKEWAERLLRQDEEAIEYTELPTNLKEEVETLLETY